MQSNLRYTYPPVFTVDAAGGLPSQHQGAGMEPPLVPCWTLPPAQIRTKKSSWTGNSSVGCLLVMVFLTVFAALGLGAYQIMNLQKELIHLKLEMQPQHESRTPQRLVAHHGEDQKEPMHALAAHLLGQKQDSTSKILKWDSTRGRAFTNGILYHDGGLQLNESGLYFVYSRVEFLSSLCKPRASLTHTMYAKRGERVIKLMIDHREGFCQAGSKEYWTVGSNLGSIHQLNQNDWVFVNVSQPELLTSDGQSNYFGLFKLP